LFYFCLTFSSILKVRVVASVVDCK
jgi:hypothetical protein